MWHLEEKLALETTDAMQILEESPGMIQGLPSPYHQVDTCYVGL